MAAEHLTRKAHQLIGRFFLWPVSAREKKCTRTGRALYFLAKYPNCKKGSLYNQDLAEDQRGFFDRTGYR